MSTAIAMRMGVERKNDVILRGDIYLANLGKQDGSIQAGIRPVLVVSNNIGNRFSPVVIVAPITSQIHKAKLPTHVILPAEKYGLAKDSVILFEQIRVINKSSLIEKIVHIPEREMKEIEKPLQVSIGIGIAN